MRSAMHLYLAENGSILSRLRVHCAPHPDCCIRWPIFEAQTCFVRRRRGLKSSQKFFESIRDFGEPCTVRGRVDVTRLFTEHGSPDFLDWLCVIFPCQSASFRHNTRSPKNGVLTVVSGVEQRFRSAAISRRNNRRFVHVGLEIAAFLPAT